MANSSPIGKNHFE